MVPAMPEMIQSVATALWAVPIYIIARDGPQGRGYMMYTMIL
jgi:hypothetical protein